MNDKFKIDDEVLDSVIGGIGSVSSVRWVYAKAKSGAVLKTTMTGMGTSASDSSAKDGASIKEGTKLQIMPDKKHGNLVWGRYNNEEGWVDSQSIVRI